MVYTLAHSQESELSGGVWGLLDSSSAIRRDEYYIVTDDFTRPLVLAGQLSLPPEKGLSSMLIGFCLGVRRRAVLALGMDPLSLEEDEVEDEGDRDLGTSVHWWGLAWWGGRELTVQDKAEIK